jgi:hypothetical protein
VSFSSDIILGVSSTLPSSNDSKSAVSFSDSSVTIIFIVSQIVELELVEGDGDGTLVVFEVRFVFVLKLTTLVTNHNNFLSIYYFLVRTWSFRKFIV